MRKVFSRAAFLYLLPAVFHLPPGGEERMISSLWHPCCYRIHVPVNNFPLGWPSSSLHPLVLVMATFSELWCLPLTHNVSAPPGPERRGDCCSLWGASHFHQCSLPSFSFLHPCASPLVLFLFSSRSSTFSPSPLPSLPFPSSPPFPPLLPFLSSSFLAPPPPSILHCLLMLNFQATGIPQYFFIYAAARELCFSIPVLGDFPLNVFHWHTLPLFGFSCLFLFFSPSALWHSCFLSHCEYSISVLGGVFGLTYCVSLFPCQHWISSDSTPSSHTGTPIPKVLTLPLNAGAGGECHWAFLPS